MPLSEKKGLSWLASRKNASAQRPRSAFALDAQAALDADVPGINPPDRNASDRDTLYRHGLTLAELRSGECGTIQRLLGHSQGRLRLLEMGMTIGTHIRVLRVAAFGGPIDVLVRGYQLSLRRDEAALIWLDDDDNEK